MKIKGHQSFYIRRGWIHKGIKKVNEDKSIFTNKKLTLTDEFGIGSNMVTSLKYWLDTLGLVERKRKGNEHYHELTHLGNLILERDPYLEEISTWQLLHYNLATNEKLATTWYWFFNEYNGNRFSRENLFNNLNRFIQEKYEKEVSERSLKDDVNCFLSCYVKKRDIESPEDNIESPFTDLGLIEIYNKKNGEIVYQRTSKVKLDVRVAFHVMKNQAKENKAMDLKNIIYSPNNIGKIFSLNMYEVIDILEKLQDLGYINFTRTGGLDYITFAKSPSLQEIMTNMF
ncbi:DUF4007 family protein [Alkalithermobacter paradoxus]|uniref:DUF4007 domain-containing protein n=1 Tax=Alkalithermobacter paradoxus TaxID=29349 RepID=A0A1V4I7Q0_9FIRM|nr:hypothetical protein CLOTH_14040 [[Clostridium] thermoalcaliphilum]